MPTQALIRKLTKDKVSALITANRAGDLLEVTAKPDGVLVSCKIVDGVNAAGSVDALQVICDEDSKVVRAEAKIAADEAAKAKAEAAAAAKAEAAATGRQ